MHISEVQTYGIMKFLEEKHILKLDENFLYIARANIEWRNHHWEQGSRTLENLNFENRGGLGGYLEPTT